MRTKALGWRTGMLRLCRTSAARGATAGFRRGCASRSSSPWQLLGVPRGADLDDCKDAYRKLALALHPDTNPSAAAASEFAAVVEAYQQIAGGSARGGGASGPRGVHSVGGVLVVTLDELRQDPQYELHACRLALHADAPAEDSSATSDPGCAEAEPSGAGSLAERVHAVVCSPWDSVADLRQQLQEELALPPRLRYASLRHASGGHELIFRSQLLGEHLLLQDYGLVDGDTLHFAVRRDLQCRP